MLPLEIIIPFIGSALLLSLSPGPDNIFVLTQSVMHGRKAGVYITLGLCTGLLFHTGFVVFGISALFANNEAAFLALKITGAFYLIYLAWQAFKAPIDDIDQSIKTGNLAGFAFYQKGIIMNLTNPKVGIFFIAFLPQFTSPKTGEIQSQLITLGGLFILSALLVFCAIAIVVNTLREKMIKTPSIQLCINKLASVVFIALAVRLTLTER